MKIAYVLNTYPQPSHSFIRREIRALERAGVTVTRIAMRRSDIPLVDAQDREEAAQTTYVLGAGALRLLGDAAATAVSSPARFVRAARLAIRMGRQSRRGVLRHLIYLAEACTVLRLSRDCAHLHAHFGTNPAAVALLTHALGGPKFSFTVHGPEEFDDPVGLSLDLKIAGAKFVVGISQFGRSQLRRWAGFSDWSRLHVVHCGIEPAKFEALPMPDGPLRLVSIGRFVEQKGQMILIKAMARAPVCVHLDLVGDGPMRTDLEQAIARHGLGERVTLTGWLDETGVRDRIAAAHALILPSFAEGLPMVVMEAMAMARPVLSTYVAGTPELVRDGRTGWLVPAGDVDALAQAVTDCAAMPVQQLAEIGQAGRDRVLVRHDVDVEAARLLALMRV